MAARSLLLFATGVSIAGAFSVTSGFAAGSGANPVRKVVNLLQAMQKKVAEEGEKAEVLYQKYLCYCQSSSGDLSGSVAAAEAKVPQLGSSIEAAASRKAQLEGDLKSHQGDREAAKRTMAEATGIRSKEKAVFDKALAENKANLDALRKAVAAIEKGMAGSFLQTAAAGLLQALVRGMPDMANSDRQEVVAFLSGQQGNDYSPASGEILGILKQMTDEMMKDQEELIATEKAAVEGYKGLMAAKQKEIGILQGSIEEKLSRVANLGVEIITMKNDQEDTAAALEGDKKFAADLKKNCAEKTTIHEKEKQTRAQETVALADTIKILNDDDALELFKKTLPSDSVSFEQLQESRLELQVRARSALAHMTPGQRGRTDFILLALQGKQIGFDKVIKLINDLVATLKAEQDDDNHKKEYCQAQFDHLDDKKKGLERSISDVEAVIEEAKEGIATLTEEIKALGASIAALDKSVAEATEQRSAEHAEHKELMASNGAAKELILFAMNRLRKFYDARLYKAAPERELSRGDRIYENEGGEIPTAAPGGIANTGITALVQLASTRGVPVPPPETAAAYKKKSGGSAGVISMMDLLVQDLDKDMEVSATEEKNAKSGYEQLISESADKRRQDSKSLVDKQSAKADLQSALEENQGGKKAAERDLMGTMKYIAALHAECDWLQEYWTVRKAARSDEVGALENAKAVLSGADYSLVQQRVAARSRKFLRSA